MPPLPRIVPIAALLLGCVTSDPIGPPGIVDEDYGDGGGGSDASTTSASTGPSTVVTTGGVGGQGGAPGCGDGVVTASEECDDDNAIDDDGCSACAIDCAAGDIKEPVTGHCYRIFIDAVMQPDAEAECQAWGIAPGLGHLIAIDDADENDFIAPHIAANAWIGADDFDGAWTWVDDTPFAFENWQLGEPNHPGTEHCMFMDVEAKWHDHSCSDVRPTFVCERRGAGTF